ncbi:MAG: CHAD domain-containing protein, partial [Myxococcales bacterium]|nr:CHAD domain-containing protein [Myxococcales bacterium]
LDANLDTDAELRQAVKRTLAQPASVMLFDAIRSLAGSVPRRDRRAFNFAEAQLRAAERGVSALLPVAPTDGPRLHRLRIRMKRLRYFCEAFAPLAEDGPEGAALADRLALRAKDAARFQKELGLVHDLDVALERVADGGGALLGPAVVAAIRELRDSHATHAVERLTGELADFASTPS